MPTAHGSGRPRGGSASVHAGIYPPGVGLETPLARPLNFPLGVGLETPLETCKACWDTTPPWTEWQTRVKT